MALENDIAYSICSLASFFSFFSNFVTPLLPEESTGFIITGNLYSFNSCIASSTDEYPLAFGVLNPFLLKKSLNKSLFDSVFTDS